MSTALQLTTIRNDDNDTTALLAVGEIDASNATRFADALAQAVRGGRRVTVDLTGVQYLDSAALAALFAHVDDIDISATTLNETLLTVCGLTDLTTVRIVTI